MIGTFVIFPENLDINEKNAMDERGLAIQRHLKKRMERKRKNGRRLEFFFFFQERYITFYNKKISTYTGWKSVIFWVILNI